MPRKYSPNLLADIRSALSEAPPPENPEEITARKIVEEMFEDITELRDEGHTFESIAEVLGNVGVQLSASTLAGYYRDEIKARKSRARKAKKAMQANQQTVPLSNNKVDVIAVTLEDDEDDDIQ